MADPINWPINPAEGDIYTVNGKTYYFTKCKWVGSCCPPLAVCDEGQSLYLYAPGKDLFIVYIMNFAGYDINGYPTYTFSTDKDQTQVSYNADLSVWEFSFYDAVTGWEVVATSPTLLGGSWVGTKEGEQLYAACGSPICITINGLAADAFAGALSLGGPLVYLSATGAGLGDIGFAQGSLIAEPAGWYLSGSTCPPVSVPGTTLPDAGSYTYCGDAWEIAYTGCGCVPITDGLRAEVTSTITGLTVYHNLVYEGINYNGFPTFSSSDVTAYWGGAQWVLEQNTSPINFANSPTLLGVYAHPAGVKASINVTCPDGQGLICVSYTGNMATASVTMIPGADASSNPIYIERVLGQGVYSILSDPYLIYTGGLWNFEYPGGSVTVPLTGMTDPNTPPVGTFSDGEWTVVIANEPCNIPFVMKVNTTYGDGFDNYTLPYSTSGYPYNYDVYWEEEGNPSNNGSATGQTGSYTINFVSGGTYIITISGLFPAISSQLAGSGNAAKVVDVLQWGSTRWLSLDGAFCNCINLPNFSASDTPDTSLCIGMSNAFFGAIIFDHDLSMWDVRNVQQMVSTFMSATNFNGNITTWNTRSLYNMVQTFSYANTFNQNIGAWNTSSVNDMSQTFEFATAFNQDVSGWDTSSVANMSYMFSNAAAFNQDLSTWCVSLIPSAPTDFDAGATTWVLARPSWGTCPP